METTIRSHLLGIYSILQARINLINASIGHRTTEGEETEDAVKSLLADSLPSDYGIGSGIIIGTDGEPSKQVDIIIYNRHRANYTLSASSRIFFADHVIAAIEIKTTYGTGKNSSLKRALANIASVKKLKVAPHEWKEDILNPSTQQYKPTDCKPIPPLGIVFFFRSPETQSALDIDRFFKILKKAIDQIPVEQQPDLLFSLDHAAFFRYPEIGIRQVKKQEYSLCIIPTADKNKGVIIRGLTDDTKAVVDFADTEFSNGALEAHKLKSSKSSLLLIGGDTFNLVPLVYRVAKVRGKFCLLDKFRAFINFIWLIEKMVAIMPTRKPWQAADYAGKDFSRGAIYPKDFG